VLLIGSRQLLDFKLDYLHCASKSGT
jgi:hypothetical protein